MHSFAYGYIVFSKPYFEKTVLSQWMVLVPLSKITRTTLLWLLWLGSNFWNQGVCPPALSFFSILFWRFWVPWDFMWILGWIFWFLQKHVGILIGIAAVALCSIDSLTVLSIPVHEHRCISVIAIFNCFQKCINDPVSLNPHQHLVLSLFVILTFLIDVR